MLRRGVLVLGVLTVFGMAVGCTREAAIAQLDGDKVKGAELYSLRCSECHGEDAQGGTPGPNIVGTKEDKLIRTMLNGEDEMPPFDALTDQELADIAAFVSSLE